uniref:Uncharacterized protein n=1 Tax=Clytia hemisphaerica TaxID=252671 RepID=A0A7M5UKY8_9CNID
FMVELATKFRCNENYSTIVIQHTPLPTTMLKNFVLWNFDTYLMKEDSFTLTTQYCLVTATITTLRHHFPSFYTILLLQLQDNWHINFVHEIPCHAVGKSPGYAISC